MSAGPRSRSLAAPVILLACVGLLEVTLFLGVLVAGVEGEGIPVLLLALITILVGAGPILFNMVQRPEKRQLLITLVTAVYVVYLVVPVFTQYFFAGVDDMGGSFRLGKFPPHAIARAQVLALVALVMLLLGFYLPVGRVAASLFPKPTREWPPNAALMVALLTIAVGWLVYLPGQFGLIPARAGSGALGTVASGSYFAVALLTLTWLRHRRPEALLLLVIVIPLTMCFNFFTGSKKLVLSPPFVFALSYIVFERKIRMKWLAAGLGALVILYPASNLYRATVFESAEGGRFTNFVRNPSQFFDAFSRFTEGTELGTYMLEGIRSTGRRLDGLGVLTKIVMDTPERVPYQGGWTIGYIALSYVPRLIWENKPGMTIGVWVSQSYGSPYDRHTHVGPTWIGELYFNWGYAGVVLGMFTFGFLCRILQERLFGWNAPIPALFGAVVVLNAVCRSVQGGLIGPINGTVYNLAPILIAHQLVGLLFGYHRGGIGGADPASHAGPVLDARALHPVSRRSPSTGAG